MTGYEYYADDPYGYPNGYTHVPLASNGYSTDRAGCRAACDADELGFDCVVFMSHPGDNCYLFAQGVATGWNDQGHTSADGGWTTYRKCSGGSCANAEGADGIAAQGYNYRAGTNGNGHPNGYTRFLIGAGYNGGAYAESTSGCAEGCDDDMLGFACVTFMYHPGNNCYLFAEGSATGWNAGNGNPWRTFDRCTVSLRTAASDCSECGEGRYQGSPGSSTCEGCGAGRYHEAADGDELRTSNEDCTACETGQYQGSTASTSCNPCSAGSYRTGEGGNAANQCIAWSALLPTIFHESCRPSIRSISKLIGSFGHCLQRIWSCEHTRYHWPRQLHRMQRREIHIRDRRHRRRRFGAVRAVLSGQIRR